MDFKKKWQRFWTLDRHHAEGFTLVELVIVIAILAILAGVAVPAYNGYTKKAYKAADMQLMSAVATAFASACMEDGIDMEDVESATFSIIDQKIHTLTKVEMKAAEPASLFSFLTITASAAEETTDGPNMTVIRNAFIRYYTESNPDAVFKTVGLRSVVYKPGETGDDCFVLSEDCVDTPVTLSNGKEIIISAEDMTAILNSTYADMGYSGVKEVIDNVGKSGETLAGICSLGTTPEVSGGFMGIGGTPTGEYSGLLPKLTNAMKAYGLIDADKEKEMLKNLCLVDDLYGSDYRATDAERNQSIQEAANGLSMITSKYLASGGNVDELLGVNLGDNSTGVIEPMATGTGGVKTVSAIAVQYAMASGFANSSASEGVKIGDQTVAEYLASADDPIKAIDTVKNLDAYKNNYVGTDQYDKDKNGFVGTMSILGDNLDNGNIDKNAYLSNGLASNDAKDVLTSVLGK